MATFPYNRNLPNPPDYPGDDAPDMQTNTNSIQDILAVDHITLGNSTPNGGTHVQNSFCQFSSGLLPTLTANASVAYPAAGSADTSRAQYYFKNSQTNFLLSGIRAYALFSVGSATPPTPPPIIIVQAFNCTITRSSLGVYVVTIINNAVVDPSYGVFVQIFYSDTTFYTVQKTGVNQFTINVRLTSGPLDPTQICFQVYQV